MHIALATPPSSAFGPAAGVWWFQACAIAAALVLGMTSINEDPGRIAVIATLTFLLGGLPHGAFDIHLAAHSARLGPARLALFTAVYVGLFALMLIGWAVLPGPTLVLFLVGAAVHFGADWPETDEPLFRVALGFAPICAIGVGHLSDVETLFAAMASPGTAVSVRALIVLVAPITLLVATVALLVTARRSGVHRPAMFAALLASLIALPPLIGFALFFCAFHTPQHLIALRTELADWPMPRLVAVGGGVTCLALVIGTLALPLIAAGGILTAASGFQLLAALAAPHQSMKFILSRLV